MLSEYKLNKVRLAGLKKWRSEIGDEFERWPMFYTSAWFISQMRQIDNAIREVEILLYGKSLTP